MKKFLLLTLCMLGNAYTVNSMQTFSHQSDTIERPHEHHKTLKKGYEENPLLAEVNSNIQNYKDLKDEVEKSNSPAKGILIDHYEGYLKDLMKLHSKLLSSTGKNITDKEIEEELYDIRQRNNLYSPLCH